MKKIGIVIVVIILVSSCIVSLADVNTPVGIWVLACHNDNSETFYTFVFSENGTAMLYEMIPSWSMTAVIKIKWSLSGETIKYNITEKDKGYSASVPVTLDFDSNLSYRDGIVYLGKNPMTKIESYAYSK